MAAWQKGSLRRLKPAFLGSGAKLRPFSLSLVTSLRVERYDPAGLGRYGILKVPRKICFRFPGAAAIYRLKPCPNQTTS
ncbi:MAG: hypothetical protein WBN75_18375 [Verrucomicrobiia bacterium]